MWKGNLHGLKHRAVIPGEVNSKVLLSLPLLYLEP